ncbi:Hypothetical predicted protein [Podarcis lilfordi]|uniref:Uncharacterized protein n=1 Tax=Podarcis lilfordi TaxID=74358 RepID=A0AA35L7J0_9SAUR|nr:Hypothetical predicted protein [Podarcis lilfordi]
MWNDDFVQKLQVVNNARKTLCFLRGKKISVLFYFYNDEFNRWFSLKMKNPGCFVCAFCVLHCAPQKLTLSQFFPLPSYGLAPKEHEREKERCHLSSRSKNQPEGEEQSKACLGVFPTSFSDFFLCRECKRLLCKLHLIVDVAT